MIVIRLFLLASLVNCLSVVPAQAQLRPTDLVIDEFDEPVSISLPVPLVGGNAIVQTDIGPLFASRRTRTYDPNLRARGEFGAADSVPPPTSLAPLLPRIIPSSLLMAPSTSYRRR